MTNRLSRALMLLASLGAVAAIASPVLAQQTTSSTNRQRPDANSWQIDNHPLARRAPAQQRTKDVPTIDGAPSGRVPLESGSFGLETNTRLKANTFDDGRRIPGRETNQRNDPSYFGLSLTVPNDSKQFPLAVPQPIPSPFGRSRD